VINIKWIRRSTGEGMRTGILNLLLQEFTAREREAKDMYKPLTKRTSASIRQYSNSLVVPVSQSLQLVLVLIHLCGSYL